MKSSVAMARLNCMFSHVLGFTVPARSVVEDMAENIKNHWPVIRLSRHLYAIIT